MHLEGKKNMTSSKIGNEKRGKNQYPDSSIVLLSVGGNKAFSFKCFKDGGLHSAWYLHLLPSV
jgi:hypothetical protein